MTGLVHIRQRYRDEFEQLGADDLRKRLQAGIYDDDKRKAGFLWLDEQEHGEDRTYKAEQLRLQRESGTRATIALVVSIIALGVSAGGLGLAVWLATHATSAYPPEKTEVTRSIPGIEPLK